MLKYVFTFLLTGSLCMHAVAAGHGEAGQYGNMAVSCVFDAGGTLWRVSVKEGVVQVDASLDLGRTFSIPVKVHPAAQAVATSSNVRPLIAIEPEGNIYVAWTEILSQASAGYIRFARSSNGGKSFDSSVVINQERADSWRRLEAMQVSPDSKVTLVWTGGQGSGAAIFYAESANQGVTFTAETKLAGDVGNCTQLALTNKPDGALVAMWRHVFDDGERDYALAEISATPVQASAVKRATFGRRKTDGCPHHGVALATGGAGKDWWGYHMVYFDANDKKPGLYYSRMDGVAWASSPARRFGNHQHQAGQPAILSLADSVWLVWYEVDGEFSQIFGMHSEDGGRNWQDAKLLASSAGEADSPQLIAQGSQVYLAWNTVQQGFSLIKLD